MPPFELQQEVLPIQLPMQPLNVSRRRTSRIISWSDAMLAASSGISAAPGLADIDGDMGSKATAVAGNSTSFVPPITQKDTLHNAISNTNGYKNSGNYTSPLAWLSRVITKAGQDERLHYHPNGGAHQHHHHHHHHHHHQQSRSHSRHVHGYQPLFEKGVLNEHGSITTAVPLSKQLFSKATVVTLEKKYASVHWAAEFYCTISSPFFALPLLLYLDPSFRWSAPEIHTTHFAILLSVLTAATSTMYHATLYKIFSSLDACFATIMFYLNTIHLFRSLPDPYAMMIPDPISSIVHWGWTPYLLTSAMMTLFIFSWKRTAMLSLLLMVLMIPPTIWGFVVHESWAGLSFGLIGLSMFAADRFKFFCGHSYWHLAGGLSLWYGLASGALAN